MEQKFEWTDREIQERRRLLTVRGNWVKSSTYNNGDIGKRE